MDEMWNVLTAFGAGSPLLLVAFLFKIKGIAENYMNDLKKGVADVSLEIKELRSDLDRWEHDSSQSRREIENISTVMVEGVRHLEKTIDRLATIVANITVPPR